GVGHAVNQEHRHRSAAGDLGEEKDLAVRTDRLEERVLVDLAVDGDRDALFEVRPHVGVKLGELVEELLDGRRRELKLGDALRQLREVPNKNDSRHFTWGPRNGPHTPTRSERPGGPVALLCLASLVRPWRSPRAL